MIKGSLPKLLWLPEDETVLPPEQAHSDDSGYDVRAWKFVKVMTAFSGYEEREVKPDENGIFPGITSSTDKITLNPGERVLISTGFKATVVPPADAPPYIGYDISICSRSSTPFKEGLVVANQPGTIDCSYRGPIMVALVNIGRQARTITKGDRIAQMIIRPVVRAEACKATELPDPESSRGEGGFGSSGKT